METALRHPPVAGHPLLLLLAAAIVLSGCSKRGEIPIDGDDIAGVVTSTAGPEAGVWVIAEPADLDTRFARIVVTDAQGRYLIPDLPPASYQVWVRGYGLTDSGKVSGKPGTRIDLAAKVAPDAATAAQVYPAAYWYAMVKLPTEAETASLRQGRNEYLMWVKNMGCVGCHQLGQLSTRTLPPSLGKFNSSHDAWLRRISSGQAGNNMIQIAAGTLGGLPLKYLSEWTDRVALGVHLAMRVREAREDLAHDEERDVERDALLLLVAEPEHSSQVEAVDELGRHVQLVRHAPEVVDLHDVRVLQPAADARLLHEHLEHLVEAPARGVDALDRYRTSEAIRPAHDPAPHDCHAALPEGLDQLVTSRQHTPGAIFHDFAHAPRPSPWVCDVALAGERHSAAPWKNTSLNDLRSAANVG
jgi:hypothetical protein